MTACLRASATLTMRAHLGASKLPRDPLRDLNAPMLTAQHLCRRSRSCSVDAFASEANRRDATRLAAASWPRPDGRHSSPSHRNSTNYGVDDMPFTRSLQRRMGSLRRLSSLHRCPKIDVLDAFRFVCRTHYPHCVNSIGIGVGMSVLDLSILGAMPLI